MSKTKKYSEKLKDPRWQKKRLEILNRDDFTCCYCGDNESTLMIHHLKYSNGDPWEIDDKYLVTLCEDCHRLEHEEKPKIIKQINDIISFYSFDVVEDIYCFLGHLDSSGYTNFITFIRSLSTNTKFYIDLFNNDIIKMTRRYINDKQNKSHSDS